MREAESGGGAKGRVEGRGLKATGLFLAGVCLVMFVYDLVYTIAFGKYLATNLLYCGILAVSVAVFALSALRARFAWIQPLALLLTAALPTFEDPTGGYGVCFFLMGVVLLVRLGFFDRHRLLKILALITYYAAVVVASALAKAGSTVSDFVSPTLFIVAVAAFLLLSFEGRIAVYLKEPRPRLSLAEKGLSGAEKSYVRALLEGSSIKEIAYDYEISDSTVRNTLARAYKKLGVEDKSALALLGQEVEIVD